MKDVLRFRLTAHGFQVFVGGKWIAGDANVAQNVINELYDRFPRQAVIEDSIDHSRVVRGSSIIQ